jgi:excisionase family DNA binding protein
MPLPATDVAQLPPVLTAEQAAQLVDCTPESIAEAARRKELPGLKMGRSWVFPTDALLQVLNAMALKHVDSGDLSPGPQAGPKVRRLHLQAPAPAAPKRPARGASPAPLPDPPRVGP